MNECMTESGDGHLFNYGAIVLTSVSTFIVVQLSVDSHMLVVLGKDDWGEGGMGEDCGERDVCVWRGGEVTKGLKTRFWLLP